MEQPRLLEQLCLGGEAHDTIDALCWLPSATRGQKMTQPVRFLPCKHKDLSSYLQYPYGMPDAAVCAPRAPVQGRFRQKDPRGLHTCKSIWIDELWVPWEILPQIIRWTMSRKTLGIDLLLLHVHIHVHTHYVHTYVWKHTHTHTHTNIRWWNGKDCYLQWTLHFTEEFSREQDSFLFCLGALLVIAPESSFFRQDGVSCLTKQCASSMEQLWPLMVNEEVQSNVHGVPSL